MFMPMVQGGISLDGGHIIQGSGLFNGSSGFLKKLVARDISLRVVGCLIKRRVLT
mgnify:CR=1 FL=1